VRVTYCGMMVSETMAVLIVCIAGQWIKHIKSVTLFLPKCELAVVTKDVVIK